MSNPKLQLGSDDTYHLQRIIGNDRVDLTVGITSSKTALSILDLGNVGIGITNPTQQLHIQNDALIQGGDLYLVDTNEKIASNGTDLFFHVGGSETVRFKTGGNVGIGTNNPTQKLHVQGDALIEGNNLYLGNIDQVISSNGFDMFVTLFGSDVIRFTPDPFVGIGTDSPTVVLDILGGQGSAEIKMEDTSGNRNGFALKSVDGGSGTSFFDLYAEEYGGGLGNTIMRFYTKTTGTASERMRINQLGNVGIGTTNPVAKLTINTPTTNTGQRSTVALISGTATGAELTALNLINNAAVTDGNATALAFNTAGTYSPTGKIVVENPLASSGNAKMHFYTYGGALNNRMTLDSNGYLGIGLTSPTNNLHIKTSLAFGGISIEDGVTNCVELGRHNANGVGYLRLKNLGDNPTGIFLQGNGISYINGGNVGIGTTNPNYILHAYNTLNASRYITITNTNNGSSTQGGFRVENDTSSLRIQTQSSGYITNGLFRQNAAIISAEDGLTGGLSIIARDVSGIITFGTNGFTNERMRITANGNVGIGTTNPLSTLHVNGNIRTVVTELTTGTHSLNATHSIIKANTSGGNITINLPAVSGYTGAEYKIIKTNASNSVTIDANASELIDGVTTNIVLTGLRDRVLLVCDGTEWHTF